MRGILRQIGRPQGAALQPTGYHLPPIIQSWVKHAPHRAQSAGAGIGRLLRPDRQRHAHARHRHERPRDPRAARGRRPLGHRPRHRARRADAGGERVREQLADPRTQVIITTGGTGITLARRHVRGGRRPAREAARRIRRAVPHAQLPGNRRGRDDEPRHGRHRARARRSSSCPDPRTRCGWR